MKLKGLLLYSLMGSIHMVLDTTDMSDEAIETIQTSAHKPVSTFLEFAPDVMPITNSSVNTMEAVYSPGNRVLYVTKREQIHERPSFGSSIIVPLTSVSALKLDMAMMLLKRNGLQDQVEILNEEIDGIVSTLHTITVAGQALQEDIKEEG